MSQEKKADLPEGTWAITKEDKKEIQKLGRELHKFLLEYAKANPIGDKFFPWKVITGAFDYFQQLQSQKVRLVGDDVLAVQDLLERYGLASALQEPFTHVEEPTEPAKEELPGGDSPSPAPASEAPVDPAPVVESTPNAEAPAQG